MQTMTTVKGAVNFVWYIFYDYFVDSAEIYEPVTRKTQTDPLKVLIPELCKSLRRRHQFGNNGGKLENWKNLDSFGNVRKIAW